MLEAGYGVQHLDLHLLGHGAGEALDVEFERVEAHRLDEELVARLVREGHDLRLDARAVARPGAGDYAGVERAAVEARADDLVRALVGVGEVALRAVYGRVLGREGERLRLIVAGLRLHLTEVHAACVDPRRSAGLEAAQRHTERGEALGERPARGEAVRPRVAQHLTDYGAALEVGTGANYSGAAAPDGAVCRGDIGDSAVFDADLDRLGLDEPEVRLLLERELHDLLVAAPVGLGAQRVHRRALAAVEHPVLYAGFVRRLRHLAAKGVELAHEVPLPRAAYGRVAGHVAHAVEVYRKAHGLAPEARGGKRGLYPRVARADNYYITLSGIVFFHVPSPCKANFTREIIRQKRD